MQYVLAMVFMFFGVQCWSVDLRTAPATSPTDTSAASSAPTRTVPANAITPFRSTDQGLLFTLSGSNTVGARLAPAWAKAYLLAKGADTVTITPLATANEYRISGRNGAHQVHIDVFAHGSSTGFKDLAAGTADIAMSSRAIKAEERKSLHHLGDMTDFAAENVVAIDGLAIIVHPDNPLQNLSVATVHRIFAGHIANWRDLGGPDLPIQLYARDENSGTWDTFQSLVLRDSPLATRARRFESNDELADRVAADAGGIGFVGLASVRQARALAISDGDSHPLQPETLHVATEDYPLARRLYLYKPPTSLRPVLAEFVHFAQQRQGQDQVKAIGFVSQNPLDLPVIVTSGPAVYRALAKQAQRLSMNFRFHSGSAELDNKAKRDAVRLAEFLKQPEQQAFRIQLVGFSSHKRNRALADVLSRLRATAVRTALFSEGVVTESVMGFGAELPVADQHSGKNKNERVEVWLYPADKALVIEQLKLPDASARRSALSTLKLANQ